MLNLFFSECRRFLPATVIFALAHMLLQLYAIRINLYILERDRGTQILALIFYVIAGIAFAVAQIGGYRQPNRWLWLLHRPLSRQAIFGAIALSALTMIVFAVGLPALLTVAGTSWLTDLPVGPRYYAAVPYVVMVCAIAWLIGAAVMLNPSRAAFLVIFVPYTFVLNEATAWVAVLATIATAALLALVVYGSFQPDRRTPPTSKRAMAIACAPLLLGFYFALYWSGSALFQIGLTTAGMHPLNQSAPPVDGYVEANRSDPRALLLAGLAKSGDVRAEHWKRQVALTEVGMVHPEVTRDAVRHQLSTADVARFQDTESRANYVFDHAAMRFRGIDAATHAHRHWSGLGGVDSPLAFPTIPKVIFGHIVTQQLALTHDRASGRYLLRVQLPQGERITHPPKKIGDRFYVLSNLRLIAYVPDAAKPDAPYVQLFSVKWPTPIDDAHFVSIAPLLDGTLVSTTHLMPVRVGEDGTAQQVYFVDSEGRQSTVAQRKLKRDFPLLFEHAAWLTSPLLHTITSGTSMLFELSGGRNYATYSYIGTPRPGSDHPALVWYCALLLMALAGACAWMRQRSAAWAVTCTVFGLPGLATMFVMTTKPSKD